MDDKPDPRETKGVPWADHNETEDTGPDKRREEYGEEAPAEVRGPGEESGDSGSSATERPTDEDRGDVEHDL